MQGYSISEIIAEKYTDSYYPQPILDWSQTRKINGKIVSDLRKQVKARLISEGGSEYQNEIATKATVEKYWQYKDREYQKSQARSI
ncbi:hypothetical protein [Chamaesiphon sp.]|uniref:hypothetical protein n=1 Tax=Chamaesiphon sp. TaxID=2814140 RepID=UPI00359469CB